MPIDSEVADLLIAQVKIWQAMGVDTLVLGCTHYPFFRQFLESHIESMALPMMLIDSGVAIAQRVKQLLTVFCIGSQHSHQNTVPLQLYATRLDAQLLATIHLLTDNEQIEPIYHQSEQAY